MYVRYIINSYLSRFAVGFYLCVRCTDHSRLYFIVCDTQIGFGIRLLFFMFCNDLVYNCALNGFFLVCALCSRDFFTAVPERFCRCSHSSTLSSARVTDSNMRVRRERERENGKKDIRLICSISRKGG